MNVTLCYILRGEDEWQSRLNSDQVSMYHGFGCLHSEGQESSLHPVTEQA